MQSTLKSRSPSGSRQSAVRRLGNYLDERGSQREIVSQQIPAGGVLVIDRDATSCADSRLVGHLAPEEPAQNASLLCALYLQDGRSSARRCLPIAHADLLSSPAVGADGEAGLLPSVRHGLEQPTLDGVQGPFVLQPMPGRTSIPQLRWAMQEAAAGACVLTSLREVISRLQSYEPALALTRRALAMHDGDQSVSTAALKAELMRILESPIVLNRRLRECVLEAVEHDQLTLSEIALRCGRTKRDRRGNESGETSWLARRIGLLSEAGRATPTPWIHSDVLGLIARQGLGLSPREVEV